VKREYVFRVLTRDPDRPLDELELIEFGVEDSEAFGKAVAAIGGLLNMPGSTPEKVAKQMRHHRQEPRKIVLVGKP
jgi:hypothetical protein